MAGVAKVILLGNVTRDPELRHLQSGTAVLDISVAVNDKYTTKDGEAKESVTFVDVTIWGKQAETCAKYLSKGKQVHVIGKLKQESWEDKKSGEKRSKLKVEADQFGVTFLGGGKKDDEGGSQGGGRRTEPEDDGWEP